MKSNGKINVWTNPFVSFVFYQYLATSMLKVQTVLIVDDDDDDREMFCEAVNEISKAITCIHATDGLAALELLSQQNNQVFDLIFLDLNMPGLNGKQCLAEIKKLDKVKDVPVIIYSTSNHVQDKEDTKRMGAANFLHKPTRFDALCNELQGIFSTNFT